MSAQNTTNMDFLTSKMRDNWWTRTLMSTQSSRVDVIQDLISHPISTESNLCDICRAIQWEYLLIGDINTGYKRSSNETVCLGLRSEVEQRSLKGCVVCARLVRLLIEEIDKDASRDPNATRRVEKCIHLDVSDSDTSQVVQQGHASYYADVSIRAFNNGDGNEQHEPAIVCADTDGSSAKRRRILKPSLVLVDNPLSAYRSVPSRVDFSKCKEWLEGCCDRHTLCNDAHERDENSPIKLIDVSRLCVVSLDRKGNVEYAALSYVCGPGYSLCVLGGSEGWFSDDDGNMCHMLPNEIPSTIRDATIFAGQLGLQYLWVDSICIAQDNEDEKKAQIGLMYSIYSDATVTIVSAAGNDSHTPLAGVSDDRIHLPGRKVAIKDGMSLGLSFPGLGTVLAQYRYMRRAWTYQELLLSKRIFFFTAQEVFYYCAMSTHRESRVEQRDGHAEAESWSSPSSESKSHLIGNAVTMRRTKDSTKLCRLFAAVVQEYSSRELSYQEDTINAFRGTEGLIKQLTNSRAIRGCPFPMLLNCLAWKDPRINTSTSELPRRRMCTKTPEVAVLPTWIWCSYDGPVTLRILSDCYPNSLCRFYTFGPIMREMSRILPEIAKGTGCVCSKPEHNLRIENYLPLPIHTRTAKLTVVAEGDEGLMPGQADLLTTSGQYLGPCDFRGQARLDEMNGLEVTFAQLYQRKSKLVTVLVLSTCRVLDFCDLDGHVLTSSGLQEFMTNLLVPERRITQIAAQPTTSNGAGKQVLEGDCSEAALIKDGSVPELGDVFVGSRLGVAHIEYEEWARLQSRESVVILI